MIFKTYLLFQHLNKFLFIIYELLFITYFLLSKQKSEMVLQFYRADKVELPHIDGDPEILPPPYTVRLVFIYGRSHSVLEFSKREVVFSVILPQNIMSHCTGYLVLYSNIKVVLSY